MEIRAGVRENTLRVPVFLAIELHPRIPARDGHDAGGVPANVAITVLRRTHPNHDQANHEPHASSETWEGYPTSTLLKSSNHLGWFTCSPSSAPMARARAPDLSCIAHHGDLHFV
jgi:hypothetical protein